MLDQSAIGSSLMLVCLIAVASLLLLGLSIVGVRMARLVESRALLLSRIQGLEARLARLEAERSGPLRADPAVDGGNSDRRADAGQPWRPDRRLPRREDGPILIAVPDLASTGARNSAEAMAEFDRRFGPVWGLADEGLGDDEIAARTGYPAGQVELILGLRRPPGGPPPIRIPSSPSPESPPGGDDPDA